MHRHFRIAGRILRRQRPDSRNCPEPGATGGSAFELAGLALHIEKDFTDEVFRNLFVKPEPKHPDMLPSVQHMLGEPVALSDPSDQDVVRSRPFNQWPSCKVGLIESAAGSTAKARFFELSLGDPRICDVTQVRRGQPGIGAAGKKEA
jgi:hypothetical protein